MKKLFLVVVMLVFSSSAIAGEWRYSEKEDKMRGTKSNTAFAASQNSVKFEFPYNGGSHLLVVLNKDPSIDGLSVCGYNQCTGVMLSIFKGQFDCLPMYEQDTDKEVCYVSVKFDDNPIEKYVVQKISPASIGLRHDSNIKFLEKLTSAKRLVIEADFFNQGTRQFQFDIKDLKWSEDRESGTHPAYSQPNSVW